MNDNINNCPKEPTVENLPADVMITGSDTENNKKGAKRGNGFRIATFIISLTALVLTLALVVALLFGIFPIDVGRVLILRVSDNYGGDAERENTEEMLEDVKRSVVIVSVATPSGITTGSGTILTEDGYIVTNHHVIQNAISVSVTLYGEEYGIKAEIIGHNEQSDIAILKIPVSDLNPATFADSSECRVGEQVFAIGNPAGQLFAWSVSEGIVSGRDRTLKMYKDGKLVKELNVIQTDAAINNGSSGGPLINTAGQVIGIVTLKLSEENDLGFALSSNDVIAIVEELVE